MTTSVKSKAYALLTAAAVAVSCMATLPAPDVSAASAAKTAVVTILGNYAKKITFSDVGSDGAYKTLPTDFKISVGSPGDSNDRTDDVAAAILEKTGDYADVYSIKVKNIRVDYTWEFKTERTDAEVNTFPFTSGTDSKGKWVDADVPENKTLTDKTDKYDETKGSCTYSGSITSKKVASISGKKISNYGYFSLNAGTWSDNKNDSLTFKVNSVTLSVSYEKGTPSMDFSELKGYKYLTITYKPYLAKKCTHPGSHSADEKYCPWAAVAVGGITTSGTDTGKKNKMYEVRTMTSDKSVCTVTVAVSDIYKALGTKKLKNIYFENRDCEIVSIKGSKTKPNLTLETGRFSSGKIQEAMDWSPSGDIPTGKPDLNQIINIMENPSGMSLKGYKALKITYTMKNPKNAGGVVVVLHGWASDGVGWEEKYYAAEKEGTIIIDLSKYQNKTINNIYVGPVAKSSAKIGDTFTPGFEITSAELLGSYSGSYSSAT
ncbi:MAG: hypothetical protein SOU50_09200 [Oscillospiraceae bacterium]|nr:hypothetical protein [Oscillospiraceae bacterium]MDY2848373.1 hypothetical protein [Oscillospiraceae bacterium]